MASVTVGFEDEELVEDMFLFMGFKQRVTVPSGVMYEFYHDQEDELSEAVEQLSAMGVDFKVGGVN